MPTAQKICFITGFARSGTTVLTEAIALAFEAPMLTVGDLALYMPPLATLLETLETRPQALDRGVDGRPVSADMPEEYCVFLATRSKNPKGRYASRNKTELQALADTVAARATSHGAVMKNPWDTTNEARLLRDFPHASVVIVRRALAEIEASQRTAASRQGEEREYMAALMPNRFAFRLWEFSNGGPRRQRLAGAIAIWNLRLRALRLASQLHRLPPERTALLSYDEFKTDPQSAAAWAAHLMDPEILSREFVARCAPFGGAHEPARGSVVTTAIDRYWAKQWKRARAVHAQARA